ncbi:MAG: hypothetical protein AAF195_01340, partial [Pseudomonadota bacterium]
MRGIKKDGKSFAVIRKEHKEDFFITKKILDNISEDWLNNSYFNAKDQNIIKQYKVIFSEIEPDQYGRYLIPLDLDDGR